MDIANVTETSLDLIWYRQPGFDQAKVIVKYD
jgi:hypothetical protein